MFQKKKQPDYSGSKKQSNAPSAEPTDQVKLTRSKTYGPTSGSEIKPKPILSRGATTQNSRVMSRAMTREQSCMPSNERSSAQSAYDRPSANDPADFEFMRASKSEG